VYCVDDEAVWILRVVYGRRQLEGFLYRHSTEYMVGCLRNDA
jgi:hypothetical protein